MFKLHKLCFTVNIRRAKFHPPFSHTFAASTSDVYMHEYEHIPQNSAVKELISVFMGLSRNNG